MKHIKARKGYLLVNNTDFKNLDLSRFIIGKELYISDTADEAEFTEIPEAMMDGLSYIIEQKVKKQSEDLGFESEEEVVEDIVPEIIEEPTVLEEPKLDGTD